jgi:putative flippase GtrA
MGNIRNAIWTFGKAETSAGIASAADFGITILLAQVCGMWYALASFLGALSGGIVNCCINYRWVFHSQSQKKSNVALKYFLVWTVSIALNTYGTYFFTELTGISFIIIKAAVSIIVAVFWNYQMQRLFVFKCRPKKE